MRIGTAAFLFLFATMGTAMAGEVNVVGQATLAGAMRALAPQFEKESGDKLNLVLGNPGVTGERIRNNTPADVHILGTALLNKLKEEGLVDDATRVALGKTQIGMAVPAGAAKPAAFNDKASFIAFIRQVKTIGLVDPKGGSGTSPPFMAAVEKLGLAAEIAPKYRYFAGAGEAVADAIARHEVEAGVTAITELAPNKGVQVIGPIPGDVLQFGNITYAMLAKNAKNIEGAKKFLAFLKSPAAAREFTASGLSLAD